MINTLIRFKYLWAYFMSSKLIPAENSVLWHIINAINLSNWLYHKHTHMIRTASNHSFLMNDDHRFNIFCIGLKLYGKDWKKIEAMVGTRNGAQIRSHAQKFFSKISKTGDDKTNTRTFKFLHVFGYRSPRIFKLISSI